MAVSIISSGASFLPKRIRSVTFQISPGIHQANQLSTALTIRTGIASTDIWVWLAVSSVTKSPDWTNYLTQLAMNPPEFSDANKGSTLTPFRQQFISQPLQLLTDVNGDVSVNGLVNQTPVTPFIPDFWVVSQFDIFVSRQLVSGDYTP